MKRIIICLLAVISVASCLASCNGKENTKVTTTTTTVAEKEDVKIPPETVLHSSLYEIDLSKYVTKPESLKYENLMMSKAFIDKAVQDDIKTFIQTYGTPVEYEDAEHVTVKGDMVAIYYTGKAHDPSVTLSETTLAGMTNADSENPMTVTIGSGSMIGEYKNDEKPELNNPGFEDQLIGHKKGDKYVMTVTFPDEYSSDELEGLVVDFEIEIKSVSYIKETELTDEMVSANTSYKTVDEFVKDSEKYFLKHHTYEGVKDVIKVTAHENSEISTNNMLIEFLFKDLGLVMTQGEYEKRLEAHYDEWYAYYLYYYGISTPAMLEEKMGKDTLIIFFEEDMIKEKLVEFVTMTE